MPSVNGIFAFEHGTKQPIYAIRMQVATYLMKVLLPPMLGPVMIFRFDSPSFILHSLLMQAEGSATSIRGCLLSTKSNVLVSLISGLQ